MGVREYGGNPSFSHSPTLPLSHGVEPGLWLEFYDRRGWLVDAYHLPLSVPPSPVTRHPSSVSPPTVSEEVETLAVRGEQFELAFDRTTGQLRSATVEGTPVLLEGPTLHVLPWADAFAREPDPQTWTLRDLRAQVLPLPPPSLPRFHSPGDCVIVTIEGSYAGFEGRYELAIDGAGCIQATYHFTRTGPELAVRELGVRFAVPRRCDTLRWKRRAEFSVYPDDHIGRPVGEARPFPSPHSHTLAGPPWPWSQDSTLAGSNDFRSTKRNLLSGSLTDPDGLGVGIDSNGEQHLRAAVEGDRIAVYVNDWYGGTNCRGFFEWQGNYGTGRVLAQGAPVEGTVSLRLLGFHPPDRWGRRQGEGEPK